MFCKLWIFKRWFFLINLECDSVADADTYYHQADQVCSSLFCSQVVNFIEEDES